MLRAAEMILSMESEARRDENGWRVRSNSEEEMSMYEGGVEGFRDGRDVESGVRCGCNWTIERGEV